MRNEVPTGFLEPRALEGDEYGSTNARPFVSLPKLDQGTIIAKLGEDEANGVRGQSRGAIAVRPVVLGCEHGCGLGLAARGWGSRRLRTRHVRRSLDGAFPG